MFIDCGSKTFNNDLVGAGVKGNFFDISDDLSSGGKENDASSGEISNTKLLLVGCIRRHGVGLEAVSLGMNSSVSEVLMEAE